MTVREFARPVDGALFARSLGLKVFPLKPNDKRPAGEGWQRWAITATEKKIKDYGTANPGANWGVSCEPSGLLVVDIDNKNGSAGSATFKQLLADKNLKAPYTLVVETPTGGYHLYFKGEGRNTAKALGEGIDTRGVGGYVVAPGSRIDNRAYIVKQDVEISLTPSWITSKLAEKQKTKAPELPSEIIEGERNHALTSLAGTLRARNAPYPVILAAIQAMNEHQLAEPLPDDEVERIAASISQYEPSMATAAAVFTPIAPTAKGTKLASEITPATIPMRDWIMKHRYIAGFISVLVSPGGVGKSAFTMLDAVAIATGEPLTGFAVPSPAPVWLYNTEDPMDELDRRMTALSVEHGIPLSTMNRIHITSGRDEPLILAKGDHKGVVAVNQKALDHAVKYINDHGIRVFIADPFVRTHAVQENDNAQIDKVAWCFQQIIDKTNCAVGIVHHTRKPPESSSKSGMHDARGASALVNAARIVHTISTMTKEEAESFGLPEERRSWFIRLDNAKANLHPPAERADWYEKRSVTLPNTDDVGTLRHTPLATLANERKRQAHEQQITDLGVMLDQLMEIGSESSVSRAVARLSQETDFDRVFNLSQQKGKERVLELLRETLECNGKVFTYRFNDGGKTRHMIVCSSAMDDILGR